MDVDAAEIDDGTETNFWDQVVNLRNVMLEHQVGEDFSFSRKMVTKFNQIAKEKYPSLVSASSFHHATKTSQMFGHMRTILH